MVGGKVVNLNQVMFSRVARRSDVTRQLGTERTFELNQVVSNTVGTEHLIHFQPLFTRAGLGGPRSKSLDELRSTATERRKHLLDEPDAGPRTKNDG